MRYGVIQNQEMMILKTLLLISFACVLFMNAGCSQFDEPYKPTDDDRFTDSLLDKWNSVGVGHGIAVTDELRIYKTVGTGYGMYDFDDLYKNEVVLITKDKQVIKKVIEASRERKHKCNNCRLSYDDVTYHVVAIDIVHKRTGYYILHVHSANGNKCGTISTLSYMHYKNSALLDSLHELDVIK